VTSPSRPTKTSSRLSHFDQRLNMYALAATAAGVGALALAQPVEGKIVICLLRRLARGHAQPVPLRSSCSCFCA
jgi:uncharacterized protein (AIM24 family)